MSKPREFWIQTIQQEGFEPIAIKASDEKVYADDIPVIEKSAYDALAAELVKQENLSDMLLQSDKRKFFKVEELEQENVTLRAENEQLKNKIEKMAPGSHQIIEENEKLRVYSDRFRAAVKRRRDKIVALRIENERLNLELGTIHSRLTAENNVLRTANAELVEALRNVLYPACIGGDFKKTQKTYHDDCQKAKCILEKYGGEK